MCGVVDPEQMVGADVGVALRRGEPAVPEQLLDAAEVGALAEEVRRERVAQGVRADLARDADGPRGLADEPEDFTRIHARSSRPTKQWSRLSTALVKPCCHRTPCKIAVRHDPFLPTLPQHTHGARVRIDVLDVEAGKFRNAEPTRIEKFED